MPRTTRRSRLSLRIVAVGLFAFHWGQAQTVGISPSFRADSAVTPDTPIELRLNREPVGDSLAVLIDATDVTALFTVSGTKLVYQPDLLRLPTGRSDVIVHRVAEDGTWTELARFPLLVGEARPTPPPVSTPQPEKTLPFGLTRSTLAPSLTVGIKAQPAQFNVPAETRPLERATFTDATLQVSMRGELAGPAWQSQMQFDFAGSTVRQEALRFGLLGNRAPKLDLASYLIQFQAGRTKYQAGHFAYGGFRHLVNNFSSRGVSIAVPIGTRWDVSAMAMNGTSIVGFPNFLGVNEARHQLQGLTVGFEALPKRPGGLRIEAGLLNGYVAALNGIGQGSVNDVERSRGGSVRALASDAAGRFRAEGGITLSRFRNPSDPLLDQGANVVAVPWVTRRAQYAEGSYTVLRDVPLSETLRATLTVSGRHELVEPLFRSLGAFVQADRVQNELQATGTIGDISVQAGHMRFNDNLRNVPSVLKSVTRATRFSVAAPAAVLFRRTSSVLPRLGYSFDRTHQFGIPVGGGFDRPPDAIPNQFLTNQNVTADWQFQRLTVGYGYNRSFTDNAQVGRERADFRTGVHSARVGFTPTSAFMLNVDLSRETTDDFEARRRNRTWRIAPNVTWNVLKNLTWTTNLSHTLAGDAGGNTSNRNVEFDTQASYRATIDRGGLKKIQMQFFIRYADRYARSRDIFFGFANRTRVQIVNCGVNITFF